jgi:hypothetical protein
VTDATGVSFLSYRRSRSNEAALIVGSQRDRGIPTWQDISDLSCTLTEEELRRVLTNPDTASATMFVTPEVKESSVIRNVEAPLIVERHLAKDGFVAIIVAAGGLDYADMDSVVGMGVGPAYIPAWNVCKVKQNPIEDEDAGRIADLMLDHRLAASAVQLKADQPFNLAFSTRSPLMKKPGAVISADLLHRFDGRLAKPGAWEQFILPGLRSIRTALQKRASNREFHLSGQICLPAAVALGAEFLSVSGLRAKWVQDLTTFGGKQELWGLDVAPTKTVFAAQSVPAKTDATALALIVSVTHNIMDDVRACFETNFPFRALVHVHNHGSNGEGARVQLSAAEGVQIAHLAVDALREARSTYKVRGSVHLFLAVPAGLAFMIGQLLNGFGDVQTYEHMPTQQQCYVPAALLLPSM